MRNAWGRQGKEYSKLLLGGLSFLCSWALLCGFGFLGSRSLLCWGFGCFGFLFNGGGLLRCLWLLGFVCGSLLRRRFLCLWFFWSFGLFRQFEGTSYTLAFGILENSFLQSANESSLDVSIHLFGIGGLQFIVGNDILDNA